MMSAVILMSTKCTIAARINNNVSTSGSDQTIDPDHAFFFCRFDGAQWTPTLSSARRDTNCMPPKATYVGLGCLNPNDPNTIYISTEFDSPCRPARGHGHQSTCFLNRSRNLKGLTINHGGKVLPDPHHAKFRVATIFAPSCRLWDDQNSALLWFRNLQFGPER